MPFVTRKPFTGNSVRYRPGDVVKDFPDGYFRPESLIRGGFVVEREDHKPARRKSQPKVEVETLVEDFAPRSA